MSELSYLVGMRLASDMRDVVRAFHGALDIPDHALKGVFSKTVQMLLGWPLAVNAADPVLTFGRSEILARLLGAGLLCSDDLRGNGEVTIETRSRVSHAFAGALSILERLPAATLFRQVISEVAVFDLVTSEALSHSGALGLIVLSSASCDSAHSLAVRLLRETVLNIIFTKDLRWRLMPDVSLLDVPENYAWSALQLRRRPFDEAFLDVCAVPVECWYYDRAQKMGFPDRSALAASYLSNARRAVIDLGIVADRTAMSGRAILSTAGETLLTEVSRFVNAPDYFAIDAAMAGEVSLQAA